MTTTNAVHVITIDMDSRSFTRTDRGILAPYSKSKLLVCSMSRISLIFFDGYQTYMYYMNYLTRMVDIRSVKPPTQCRADLVSLIVDSRSEAAPNTSYYI